MKFSVKSNFEIKGADEKKGIVEGYASIFGNIDSDKDMIMPGAFSKTITERGPGSAKPRIKHLWQHNSWDPIGIPIELREDDKGLYFITQFGKDQFSQDKLQQHIDGIITELSIGYNTIKYEDVDEETSMQGPVIKYRKLTELKLWEYSSVTWGANSLTEVISAKGQDIDMLSELNKRIEALGKALKNGKYTDESCEQFEAEINKIQEIIKSLKEPEPVNTTQDDQEPTVAYKTILETILKALKQ
jgi:HK97 family phage prohead protease